MISFIDVVALFLTQVAFIWARTANVKAVADNKIISALLTGAIIHLTWLASIYYGVISVADIFSTNTVWAWVSIGASLTGGLAGTCVGMRNNIKRDRQIAEAKAAFHASLADATEKVKTVKFN